MALPRRLLAYNAVLAQKYGMPVATVVVLLVPQPDRSVPNGHHVVAPPFGRAWEFRYTVIKIWEIPVAELLQGPPAVLPLATIAAQPDSEVLATLRTAADRLFHEVEPSVSGRLLVAIGFLLKLRFGEMISQEILKNYPDIRESLFKPIIEETEVNGLRKTLLRMGTKKFGEITSQHQTALNAVTDIARLERLTEKILDASSWDELLRDA